MTVSAFPWPAYCVTPDCCVLSLLAPLSDLLRILRASAAVVVDLVCVTIILSLAVRFGLRVEVCTWQDSPGSEGTRGACLREWIFDPPAAAARVALAGWFAGLPIPAGCP